MTSYNQSGIIKEKSRSGITPISETAIDRVPQIDIDGFSEEQSLFIQDQHKELLRYARDNNGGKEVAFVFRGDLTDRSIFEGDDSGVDFVSGVYGKGINVFVMHNHPRNAGYSDVDIAFLLYDDRIKTLSIVKNNGDIEVLTKTDAFDKEKMVKLYKRKYRNIVKNGTDSEINEAVYSFINSAKEHLSWKKIQ